MNSPHSTVYAVIAFMLISSVVSIVYVSVQNYRAVKKYHKDLKAGIVELDSDDFSFDQEDYEEVSFFPAAPKVAPTIPDVKAKNYSIAS